ncbi:MAG TPA: EamA family transporter [Gaiellaceae bacterium]|nr:EamA family transporter [Gaiellaceae bacterium]
MTAIVSAQVGAAVARTLFDRTGPSGIVMLRLVFGAVALGLFWRPTIRERPQRELALLGAFAATLAAMNLSFYGAIDRIPLGIAVTLEFVGPLTVAIVASRRRLDLVWVGLAAAGIVLLARGGSGAVHPLGVVLALVAGACWGLYIVLSARVGGVYPGVTGVAAATAGAAVLVAPIGIATAGRTLLSAHVLVIAAGVGVLSSAIPWSLELEALRRMPTQLFGVLMSLEPAVAALAGLVVLGQRLGVVSWIAIALVVLASSGASWAGRGPAPPAA